MFSPIPKKRIGKVECVRLTVQVPLKRDCLFLVDIADALKHKE